MYQSSFHIIKLLSIPLIQSYQPWAINDSLLFSKDEPLSSLLFRIGALCMFPCYVTQTPFFFNQKFVYPLYNILQYTFTFYSYIIISAIKDAMKIISKYVSVPKVILNHVIPSLYWVFKRMGLYFWLTQLHFPIGYCSWSIFWLKNLKD